MLISAAHLARATECSILYEDHLPFNHEPGKAWPSAAKYFRTRQIVADFLPEKQNTEYRSQESEEKKICERVVDQFEEEP
jgi:hypothetical protein